MIDGEEVILSRVNLCKSCSLEKENTRLTKMLEMAMEDALSQSHYAECNGSIYGLNCSNIEEYRAKLEKRVEEHKNDNNCPDVMCDDCNKECELKKIMGETK